MYPDALFDLVGVNGTAWILIALVCGAFDYLFNFVMCFLSGGLAGIRAHLDEKSKPRKSGTLNRRSKFWTTWSEFKEGGRERINDLLADKMALVWPLTVLAIPILIYGIGRGVISEAVQSLANIKINIELYHVLPLRPYLQYLVWIFSVIFTIRSFYRYHVERSEKTFFAKSVLFHVLRNLLIILPLTYIIASIVVVWLDFSLTLYRVLIDNAIQYTVLHPDLMYGYRTVYKAILFMGVSLVIASLLPVVVFTRERGQKYQRIYTIGLYAALLAVFVSAGLLIYRFGERLEKIQLSALRAATSALDMSLEGITNNPDTNQVAVGLQYFAIVSSLPDKFIFPPFLTALLSTRTIIVVYELYRLVKPRKKRAGSKSGWEKMMEALASSG
jgi:hypothetical protein